MKLQHEEKIIKVFHHHKYFFVARGLKVWLASVPFFFLAYIITFSLGVYVQALTYIGITLLFGAIHLYDFLIYYMDTLVVTNRRVVHLDWISIFKYIETQAMLDDIQNIETHENGFFSKFPFLDFGTFTLETASTRTTVQFNEAPDPEGVKYFIYNLAKRHGQLTTQKNDQVKQKQEFIQKAELELSKVD